MAAELLGVADAAVGVALATASGFVLVSRRGDRIGVLLALASATWFLGSFWPSLVFLHLGPMVHLLLSYPTGRLHRRPAQFAVAASYTWAVAEGWHSSPTPTAALAAAVAGAAIDGYLRTSGTARRASRPALVTALMFSAILAVSAVNLLLDRQADMTVALTYDAVMVAVAAWLTLDLLRGGWTEATIADLVTQLGGDPDEVGLEAELRRALGDPSLTLMYVSASEQVDLDPPDGRVVTPVEDDGMTVAVLVHDPRLLDEPALLDGCVTALRLAVSNVRLRAEITARTEELSTARRRLVETTDVERRRLQASIAHGPARDLARARALLDGLPDAAPLAEAVTSAEAELDRFARGLRPDLLDVDGLGTAMARLAARSGLHVEVTIDTDLLPAPVEAAVYFVCAEALTNAAKHSGTAVVRLSVTADADAVHACIADDGIGGADPTGGGLQGLADRVAALGGRLTVHSPPGFGTVVVARMPIGGGGTS